VFPLLIRRDQDIPLKYFIERDPPRLLSGIREVGLFKRDRSYGRCPSAYPGKFPVIEVIDRCPLRYGLRGFHVAGICLRNGLHDIKNRFKRAFSLLRIFAEHIRGEKKTVLRCQLPFFYGNWLAAAKSLKICQIFPTVLVEGIGDDGMPLSLMDT